MNKKTNKAVDADKKAIIVKEPVYYYCHYISEREGYKIVKNVEVEYKPDVLDSKVYGKDRWHCFLRHANKEYLAQCDATDLTKSPKTIVRLYKKEMKTVEKRIQFDIDRHEKELTKLKSMIAKNVKQAEEVEV